MAVVSIPFSTKQPFTGNIAAHLVTNRSLTPEEVGMMYHDHQLISNASLYRGLGIPRELFEAEWPDNMGTPLHHAGALRDAQGS